MPRSSVIFVPAHGALGHGPSPVSCNHSIVKQLFTATSPILQPLPPLPSNIKFSSHANKKSRLRFNPEDALICQIFTKHNEGNKQIEIIFPLTGEGVSQQKCVPLEPPPHHFL